MLAVYGLPLGLLLAGPLIEHLGFAVGPRPSACRHCLHPLILVRWRSICGIGGRQPALTAGYSFRVAHVSSDGWALRDRRACCRADRAASVNAQRIPLDTTPDPDELRSIFTIRHENDVFNRSGNSDRDYTSGIRFGWLSPALPELPEGLTRLVTIPTFFGEGPVTSVTRRVGISFGQNLYTPADTTTSAPIYNDRPYAAWLYASFALQSIYKRAKPDTPGNEEPVRLDTLQLDLGVVGPAAGGEFVQNNFHRLIASRRPTAGPPALRADLG